MTIDLEVTEEDKQKALQPIQGKGIPRRKNYELKNLWLLIMSSPAQRFYRRLLQTMMKVFQGDYNMFHKCRLEARQKILENKSLTDPVEIQNKVFFGEEVRDFLAVNLMQGKQM